MASDEQERVAWELCGSHCGCRRGAVPTCSGMLKQADRAIALGARAPDPVEELASYVECRLARHKEGLVGSDRYFCEQIVRYILANAPGKGDG